MKFYKFIVILLFIAFFFLHLGCYNKEVKSNSIKIGYIPIADCLQLYVAQEKGFFTKHGLSAELVPLQGGPIIIEALVSKNVDVGFSNVVSLLIGRSKGVPIVGITGGPLETESRKTHALMVLDSSQISHPKDLSGKTIAVNALRNIEHVALMQFLEKTGVPAENVKVVEAPFPQMEGILKNKSVDVIMTIEPYISLASNNKTAHTLAYPYTEVRPRSVVSTYNVRSDWLTQNREVAKKLALAIAEATEFISNNDSEARQILLKYTNVPQEVADKIVIPEFQASFMPEDLQPWINELVKQGIIDKSFDSQEVFKQQ
jgi:NitT/TauT family transport system substrate-binding protein